MATDKALIVGLEYLPIGERRKLRSAGIASVNDFWAFIGRDSGCGILLLSEKAGIEQNRVIEIAASQALREEDGRTLGWSQRLWNTLKDHWLDLVLITAIFFLVALFFRAFGFLDRISEPIGFQNRVIISTMSLKKGAKLQPENLTSARVIPRSNYFADAGQLQGLILTQDISAGAPIRFEQVLRLQLVATNDISVGQVITKDVISLAWSLYEPEATINPDELVGYKTTRAFKIGEALQRRFVTQ